ncbi:hypothetical protein C8R45DRAFT_1100495 [Mycena sanguinolenta]|nr:hypothetical protein C8R45DRAFT_1100495 [Mycena sanguinolenta]
MSSSACTQGAKTGMLAEKLDVPVSYSHLLVASTPLGAVRRQMHAEENLLLFGQLLALSDYAAVVKDSCGHQQLLSALLLLSLSYTISRQYLVSIITVLMVETGTHTSMLLVVEMPI